MQERVTQSSVTFLNPFLLGGLDGEQSAGTYAIETTEVPIEPASFVAYRRVSTTITLPALGTASLSRQVVTIDPHELEKALRRDVSANGIRPDGR
jgi:hypothetical protein